MRRVVEQAGAASGDGPGEKGYSDGALLGYALKGADQVGTFEVLGGVVRAGAKQLDGWEGRRYIPLIHESIGLSVHPGHRCRRKD